MAKTIGSLNVSMGLSITDFITNLDKVKQDMGSLEAVTSEASKHFEEDVAGVMGDALHKFAKTSKLGADDALAFAVNLKKLGLDADAISSTLDKFGKGIGKFAKNAGEASKAFAGILGKIGESDKVLLKDIQTLESMGVKAFDALAKELSKVEGKAVSTADVMKRIASGSLSGADALKALTSGLTAVAAKITDTNTAEYIANAKTLKATTDLATKSLELQARQMNVDSGATKQLFEDMKKLEAQEIAIIALENKAKGIVTPPKVDTNTGQYVAGQIKLKSETDMVTKSLELQARQMNVDSGATKQLFEDMKKLEAQEIAIIALENKAKGIVTPPKVDTNTGQYVAGQIKLKSETDMVTKSLELQARQMNVDSGATKQLHEEMKKLEAQELAIIALENKAKGIVAPVKVDTNTATFVNEQMNLKSQTDLASKALEMQARQMNIDSGATKQLFEDMKKLELQEQKLIEAENKARGIPPPIPIMPPPIPVNKNTAEYVINAKKMASETDILNKSLDLQARQMMIDSGATKQLHDEMKKLEAQEKKLVDAENKAKGIASPVAAKESQAKSKLAAFLNHVETKIQSAASSIFSKVTNLIMNPVTAIGGALASYGVYKIYDRAVEAFANTEEILTRIKGLAGEASAERLGGVMNEIANQGRIAQDAVGKLATGFLGLGVSGADAARMIESFGRTSLVAGSGATDVFNKLGETVSSMAKTGVASKEDFAALDSMGLPVYEALAQRLTTVMGRAILAKEAIDMLAKGAVNSTDAVNALAGMHNDKGVIKQAEAQAGTLKGIYARLAGEVEGFFTQFGARIVEALDLKEFSKGLTGFMQNLRMNFDSLVPALKNIGMILSVVRDVLFDAFKGLVSFFTTMGGADMAIGGIESVRAVVIGFAQQTTNAMKQLFDFSSVMIEGLINKIGGVNKALDIAGAFGASFAAGATTAGAATLITGPGVFPSMGAAGLISGTAGAVTQYLKGGNSDEADMAAFRIKMGAMFDKINADIGASGSNAGNRFLEKFIGQLQVSAGGLGGKANDFALGSMDKSITNFFAKISGADTPFSAFLNQLQQGTMASMTIFKNEMEDGKLSADGFKDKVAKLREEGLKALNKRLEDGTDSMAKYEKGMKSLGLIFDSFKEKKAIELKVARPAWLENIANEIGPIEKFNQGMADIAKNIATLTPAQAGKAARFLREDLEKAAGAMDAIKNPEALQHGTAAAYSDILKIQHGTMQGETVNQLMIRLAKQEEVRAKQDTILLQQIAAKPAPAAPLFIGNIP